MSVAFALFIHYKQQRSRHILFTMAERKRRIFDFVSQSDDSQSYGYGGGGGGACPQINDVLHRDSRMGVVEEGRDNRYNRIIITLSVQHRM